LRAVWGDVHVDDAVLTRVISDLRKALGRTEEQVWIETVKVHPMFDPIRSQPGGRAVLPRLHLD
jgi:hypothetical protein